MNLKLLSIIYGSLLGPILASFSSVVIERGRKNISIKGRSKCICGQQLKWYFNIPIISYSFLLGKSNCCKSRIPIWYFYYELGSFVLGLILTLFFSWIGLLLLIFFIFLTSLIAKKIIVVIF